MISNATINTNCYHGCFRLIKFGLNTSCCIKPNHDNYSTNKPIEETNKNKILNKIQTHKTHNNIIKQSLSKVFMKNNSLYYSTSTNNKPTTFYHQQRLPRLPVPDLQNTLNKYLETVKALVLYTDQECKYQNTVDLTEKFRHSDYSRILQDRLIQRYNDKQCLNWLDKWWLKTAYMTYRSPLPFFVSYFFAYDNIVTKNRERNMNAALVIHYALEFKHLILREELQPETMGNLPLCMNSYRYLFNSCRIPCEKEDKTHLGEQTNNNIVCVIYKNNYYTINLNNYESAKIELIKNTLDKITNSHKHDNPNIPIGILSASHRDEWTKSYHQLINTNPKQNLNSLKAIQDSAFIVSLDENSPENYQDISRVLWLGNGCNRYYDKTLQFVVFENGKGGFIGEHSLVDGMPVSKLNEYVCTKLKNEPFEFNSQAHEFDLNNKTLNQNIEQATSNFKELENQHELNVVKYTKYGKQQIKKFKVSPDAYVQMIIQLAYYKTHKKQCPTYESASTRMYALGRTETCRSCSISSVHFVRAMMDNTQPTKYKLAIKAIDSHVKYIKQAIKGHGVDRHLFDGESIPDFFKDEMLTYSQHWKLSTSQITSEYFQGYGWGEVVEDGYGIAYMIKNNELNFNVASLKSMSNKKLAEAIEQSCDQLYEVFTKGNTGSTKSKL